MNKQGTDTNLNQWFNNGRDATVVATCVAVCNTKVST